MKNNNIIILKSSKDYELIDSGDGEKLERFGKIVLSRPDPQVLWRKRSNDVDWKKADADFIRNAEIGEWKYKKDKLDKWPIEYGGLKFWIKPTAFKHVGLFPEQAMNWEWMRERIESAEIEFLRVRGLSEHRRNSLVEKRAGMSELRDLEISDVSSTGLEKTSISADLEVLNLFGYTGGATLACAQAGAKVVHVDSSKSAMSWARENAELSDLADKPIRWILEDARVFVEREIKRGRKYDAIIMDPPAFGHGAKKEIWKIEEDLLKLIDNCFALLKDKPLFFLINGYSAGYSSIAYENIMKYLFEKYRGTIESGELAIEESGDNPRLLPCGIFARWGNI